MKHRFFIMLLGVSMLASCGKKTQVVVQNKPSQAPATVIQPEKKVEERYVYRGGNYRDPFILLTEKRMISPALAAKGDGDRPNFGTLRLRGIIKDGKTRIALMSCSKGRYVLKNGSLYDSMNRVVKGVRGTIEEKKVKLVTDDNFSCEIKFESR
jgi:hypothetical protein